jgi:hypothetical protein
MGCRVVVGRGITVMFTASHVMAQLRRCATPFMVVGQKAYPFDRKWAVYAYSSPKRLDLTGLEVPEEVWAALGVKAASASSDCPEIGNVSLFGWDAGVMSSSTGPSKSSTDLLGLDYWASSIEGWSGTPLVQQGKVVGVHRGYRLTDAANHGVMIYPFIGGFETPHRGKSYNLVNDYGDDWDEDTIIACGRKMRIKHSMGRVARLESTWVPRDGRYWADIVDDESYDGMESKRVDDGNLHKKFGSPPESGWPSAERAERMFAGSRDYRGLFSSRKPAAEPQKTLEVPKQGNDQGSSQTGGPNSQPHKEVTSGLPPRSSSAEDGKSVALRVAPSPLMVDRQPSPLASDGPRGGRRRKKKASPGSPRKRNSPKSPTSTSDSLKSLQKRVDSLRPLLSKQPISSETATTADTLLRDLLACAMRYESRARST